MKATLQIVAVTVSLLLAIGCGGGSASIGAPVQAEKGALLYVSNAEGTVSGYSVGAGGNLTPVQGSPFPNPGTSPAGVALANGYLYVANSGSPDISGFSFDKTTGLLTGIPGSPFLLSSFVGPALNLVGCGTRLFAASKNSGVVGMLSVSDSGSLSTLGGFGINRTGYTTSVAVDQTCTNVFVSNAATLSVISPGGESLVGNVGWFSISNTDLSRPVTLRRAAFTGAAPVALALDSTGRFLYVANSGSNNVSAFAIDSTLGTLTPVPGSPFAAGQEPSAVVVAGAFVYVTNAGGNSVSSYALDSATGALTPIGVSPSGSRPVAIVATSQGVGTGSTIVFTANQNSSDISAFAVGSGGALQQVPGSPFRLSGSPQGLAVANRSQ